MEKFRAIPNGYMTVGELAKRMGTTVRTLQYYDKEGLLSPSASSEGGRRLYTDKDMVMLHQILSLKSLGFSLDDIKNRLISLDTPEEVSKVLEEQATALKMQMLSMSETLNAIETLRAEVLQINTVDFKKYADIIVNLQLHNSNYGVIKHFDEKTLEHCRSNFDKDSAKDIVDTNAYLTQKAIQLQKDGVEPDSEEAIKFAEDFWNMIVKFTGGDMSMLPQLMEAGNAESQSENAESANAFIGSALEAYFKKTGLNPFAGD